MVLQDHMATPTVFHSAVPIDILTNSVREFPFSPFQHLLFDITYMWNLKNLYKRTYLQNINRLKDIKTKLKATKGERWCRGINQELGINIHTTIYNK